MMQRAFLILTVLFLNLACEKHKVEPKKIPISGFQLFDQFGNMLQHIGPDDTDWEFIPFSSLSAFEQSLLNTPDNVDLANTVETTVAFHPYPNPVSTQGAMSVLAQDSVKFKLAVVNEDGTILRQLAFKIKNAAYALDFSDRTLFPNKSNLRYYYSFSAAGKPHFKVGYGDIKICDYNPGAEPVSSCFQ